MSERNYWPHFIIGLVTFAVLMGIWTIDMTMHHPVQLEDSYMMEYQKVDSEYSKIQSDKKKFDARYKVKFFDDKLSTGKNILKLQILTKDGRPVTDANVTILLTRPYTTKYDKKLQAHYENGYYVASVKIPLEGRWDVDVKIELNGLVRYLKFRRSTRRVINDNLKRHLI